MAPTGYPHTTYHILGYGGVVEMHNYHIHTPRKEETKKERIARIAHERMKASHVIRNEVKPKHFKLHSTPSRNNRIKSFR